MNATGHITREERQAARHSLGIPCYCGSLPDSLCDFCSGLAPEGGARWEEAQSETADRQDSLLQQAADGQWSCERLRAVATGKMDATDAAAGLPLPVKPGTARTPVGPTPMEVSRRSVEAAYKPAQPDYAPTGLTPAPSLAAQEQGRRIVLPDDLSRKLRAQVASFEQAEALACRIVAEWLLEHEAQPARRFEHIEYQTATYAA